MREPVYLSWSGGKDSALALHALHSDPLHEPVGLLTTVTEEYDRISMHGVRRALLEEQARLAGLPLVTVVIPPGASNEIYGERMGAALREMRDAGVSTVAFGDLYLEEVRRYREEMLATVGMRAIFPLWGRDTAALAREFIALGFGATLACVDARQLDGSFVGREYDATLLADLPPGVDPCGENGEFHTFLHRGPVLRDPIRFERGEVVLREGRFWYCDFLAATS